MTNSNYDDWFLEIVAFYRQFEFFVDAEFHGLSDEQCKSLIEGQHPNWFESQFEMSSIAGQYNHRFTLEKFIVATDRKRIWSTDSESVYGDSNFYANGLTALAGISRNLFQPLRAIECWLENDDTNAEQLIHVKFHVRGIEHNFWLTRQSDFANQSFLTAVNEIVEHTGYQFRLYGGDQDWFIAFQNDGDVARFLKRGYSLRPTDDKCGLLQYPEKKSCSSGPHTFESCLYAHRGFFRYNCGDADGSWDDFRIATELGEPDIYERVSKLPKNAGSSDAT